MVDPINILKLARKLANEGVIEKTFGPGEFFEGGNFQVRIDEYTESECKRRGFDHATESRRLFCQGRFFAEDGREFHFVLNVSSKKWDFKMLDAGLNSWDMSTVSFTIPTTQVFLNEFNKAIANLLKER